MKDGTLVLATLGAALGVGAAFEGLDGDAESRGRIARSWPRWGDEG